MSENLDFFAQPVRANDAASGSAGARVRRLRGEVPRHPLLGKATGPGAKYFAQLALYPHVLELARSSAMSTPPGFTADDVQELARAHHIDVEGDDAQRALSWIGPWLKGLARRNSIAHVLGPHDLPVKRPSDRREAHGNAQYVYTVVSA